MRLFGVLLLSMAVAWTARAEVKHVVVLPPSRANPDVVVSFDELDDLEDAFRATTRKTVDGDDYAIISRETMLQAFTHLAGNRHLDCGAHCVPQIAQFLPAELFLASRVTQQDDRYIAYVQLFDPSGKALASAVLESVRVRNLRTQFAAKAEALYALSLQEKSPIQEVISEFTAANGLQLHFDPGAHKGKWTLFNGRDRPLCDLPCTRWVGAFSHYSLRSDADEARIEVPDNFEYEWGRSMNAHLMVPSSNVLLSPWWLILTVPGLVASGGIGLIGGAYTIFGNYYNASDQLFSAGLSVGFLAVAVGLTYWTVKITRNMKDDGLQLEPVERPLQAMLREKSAWAQVVPPARPEGR